MSIDGSWTAGVGGAKPGIANKVNPAVGDVYRQEFALNTAEDMGEVVSLTGSASLPVASCRGKCVVIKDFSSISPNSLEHKHYAPALASFWKPNPESLSAWNLSRLFRNKGAVLINIVSLASARRAEAILR